MTSQNIYLNSILLSYPLIAIMKTASSSVITGAALIVGAANAHYANMGLAGVSCYIYNS